VARFSQFDLAHTLIVVLIGAPLQRDLDIKDMEAWFLHLLRPDHGLDLWWHGAKATGDERLDDLNCGFLD
jgi:hypothetical protein